MLSWKDLSLKVLNRPNVHTHSFKWELQKTRTHMQTDKHACQTRAYADNYYPLE